MSRPRDIPLPGGGTSRTIVGGTINYESFSTPSVSVPSVSSGGSRAGGTGYTGSAGGFRIGSRSLLGIPLRNFTRPGTSLDRFRSDRLNITQTRIENNEFVNVVANGISNLRPEIISSINFSPIWKPTQLNVNNVLLRDTSDIGDYVNFQYQTKLLRQETLQSLITNIKKVLPVDPFSDIKTDFDSELRKIGSDLIFLNSVLDNIKTINNSIDIKNIPDAEYTVKENDQDVVLPSLEKIYINRMQYSSWQYKNFSETKILLQLLFDLQNILTSYSVNLINLRDNDRASDRSPTVLDKTYTLQNGFTFKISDYKSSNSLVNAFQLYEQFCISLPEEPDSIIKLLTYLIAKEYLISTGLGNSANVSLLNKYQGGIASTGLLGAASIGFNGSDNIFQNIIGNIGDTIFQPQSGNTSGADTLASLAYVNPGLGSNILVLPFENRYIQTDDQTITYVPGTAYFTDAIIKADGSAWNISPYSNFTTNFNTVYSNAKSVISNLLNLYSFTRTGEDRIVEGASPTVISALSPSELNSLFITTFQNSFNRLNTVEQDIINGYNTETYAQIETLAQQIETLKNQYYQVIDNISQNTDNDQTLAILLGFFIGPTAYAIGDAVLNNGSVNLGPGRELVDQITSLKAQIAELKSRTNPDNFPTDSLKQAFVVALYNQSSNDIKLKKYLLFISFFAGLYRNASSDASSRSAYFQKLTETDFKTFGDIINYLDNSGNMVRDDGVRPGIVYEPLVYRNVALNPNDPSFNSGAFNSVFVDYVKYVISPYISEVINAVEQTVEANRYDEQRLARDPGFFGGGGLVEIQTYRVDEIPKLLVDMILNSDGSATNIMFHQMNSLMEQLFNSTKLSNQIVHVTSNGKTKYNNLSLSTQYLFIHETFVQYAKKYSGIKLRGTVSRSMVESQYLFETLRTFEKLENVYDSIIRDSSGNAGVIKERAQKIKTELEQLNIKHETKLYVSINIDPIKQTVLQNAFDLAKSGNPPDVSVVNNDVTNTQEYHDLYDNYRKITDEFNTIKDVLGIFEVINVKLQDAYRVVNNFFKQEKLQQFLTTSTINNIDFLRYPSQIRLANQIYNDVVEKTTYGASGSLITVPGGAKQPQMVSQPLIVSDVIIPSEYNAMISMLSSNTSMFQTVPDTNALSKTITRNSKIVTIGIPTGFSKKLADRVSITNFNRQGVNAKQSDVIAINIYPNDIRFGEIVLKPFTYLFDLSLFLGKKQMADLSAQNGELFTTLLDRIKVKDYEDPYNVKELLRQDVLTDSRYSFLSAEQRIDLYNNVVISYLLGTYVNCLTGIQYSEDMFIDPVTKKILNQKTADAVRKYLIAEQQIDPNERAAISSYTNTEDILNNPRFTEKYKDTYRLMTYGSLVFNDKEVSKRVNSSKIFDRVFHVPVRLNSLEIDLDATNSTVSGRESLARAATQAAIITEGGRQYMVTNEPNDFIIKDIFCAAIQTDTGTGAGLYWSPVSDYIGAAIGRGSIMQELGATEGFSRLREAVAPFVRPGSFSTSSPLIPGGSR